LQRYNPYPIEKLISAATYLTAGGAGFIWLIIAAIFKKTVRPFLMYHILQSIFLAMLFFLLKVFIGVFLIEQILLKIPVISNITSAIVVPIISPVSLFFGLSILQVFTTTIILYLAITSLLGYYSYIPWVSDIISGNFRQK
jgi:hypothetical protein